MFDNQFIFSDVAKDQLLLNTNRQIYYQTLLDRFKRLVSARASYMDTNFPEKPLQSRQELISACKLLKNSNSPLFSEYNQKLINGQFALEGTKEWQYKEQYNQAFHAFVWPNEQEIAVRKTEEAALEKLL